MSSTTTISVDKLARLVGTPNCPVLIDVRLEGDFASDPRLIPSAVRRPFDQVSAWAASLHGAAVVVICQKGRKLSEGVAALLRHEGLDAEVLAGGHDGWAEAGLPLARTGWLAAEVCSRPTVWVTRARPKIDRIACPWLIRRFVDPKAVFLFVAPQEVAAVADRFGALPFDIEGVFWSHRGDLCTFDVMIEEFGIATEPLRRLATIVRAADTGRLELAPQAAGLLAASLGLSRMHSNDLQQLDAGMSLYDAFYRWCRDAVAETHGWTTGKQGA